MNNLEIYSDDRYINQSDSGLSLIDLKDVYKLRIKNEKGLKKIVNAKKVRYGGTTEYWKYIDDEVHTEIRNQLEDFKVSFFHNENLIFVCCFNNKRVIHSIAGPALLKYSPNGKILKEEYYIDGEMMGANLKLYTPEELQNYLILK